MKNKITYSAIKHWLKWTANQSYPARARIIFIRNKDMIMEKHLHYKSKEDFKRDKKNYVYKMIDSYNNLKITNYDLKEIEHWKEKILITQ